MSSQGEVWERMITNFPQPGESERLTHDNDCMIECGLCRVR